MKNLLLVVSCAAALSTLPACKKLSCQKEENAVEAVVHHEEAALHHEEAPAEAAAPVEAPVEAAK